MENNVTQIIEIVLPAIKIMACLALLAVMLSATFSLLKVLRDRLDLDKGDYIAARAVAELRPEEGVYYSERDHGYWVKMPDGTKTLVDMSELYPNDAAYHKKPAELERFGTFIYDGVQKKMVRK